MDISNNVWKLYAIRFFHNLIPAYVIERLFWEERGMTIQMVVYTEIIYAVTIVLLEVPTGIIADKWGRKRMMLVDAFLGCCEFLLLLLATEFWHFALVVILAGIGRSASSGAENAMLYDTLKTGGKEQLFERQMGRLNACDIAAIMLAALSGSLLASRFGFELNYWISVGAMLISVIFTMLLVEPSAESREDEKPTPLVSYITGSLHFFRRNPGVCLVLLSGMIIGAALSYLYEFWQLYLERLEIPVMYFGLFSAAVFVLGLPGNLIAYKLGSLLQIRMLLTAVTAVIAVGFAIASMNPNFVGLTAILVICLLAGVIEPLAAGYLHHRIDSPMRATIDSFQSLGANAVLILAGLGFGYFSAQFDIFGGFGFIAAICGVSAVGLYYYGRNLL